MTDQHEVLIEEKPIVVIESLDDAKLLAAKFRLEGLTFQTFFVGGAYEFFVPDEKDWVGALVAITMVDLDRYLK